MFEAKFVLQNLILPPGLFIVLLAWLGIRALARRQLNPGFPVLLIAGALAALSAAPVSDRLTAGLEARYGIPDRPEGDVIVLLGGGVFGGSPDLTGRGFPTDGMLPRVITAARLQKRLGVPVVVSGGKAFDHLDAEAPVAARILADLGVASGKIVKEGDSRDTAENALRTKRILEEKRLRAPLLVTSAYHMPRSVEMFRRAGVAVTPVPAGYRTWMGKPYRWMDYLPSAGALFSSTAALREHLGLLYYRIVP
ncbi:MAG: YdcF family protein [Deltaproteobacteria bacterium]|nr:YdcF family protein [Deltaproteobacteria bacterium]